MSTSYLNSLSIFFLLSNHFRFSSRKTNLSMSEIQGLFLKLRSDFPHEYRLFNLESVAIPMVLPLVCLSKITF